MPFPSETQITCENQGVPHTKKGLTCGEQTIRCWLQSVDGQCFQLFLVTFVHCSSVCILVDAICMLLIDVIDDAFCQHHATISSVFLNREFWEEITNRIVEVLAIVLHIVANQPQGRHQAVIYKK